MTNVSEEMFAEGHAIATKSLNGELEIPSTR